MFEWEECCHGAFGGHVLVLLSCNAEKENRTYWTVRSKMYVTVKSFAGLEREAGN